MKIEPLHTSAHSVDKEHYRSMAASYDARIPALLPMSECFFTSCLSYLPEGCTDVLELGSGTGYLTSRILTLYPQAKITGIDHSPEMIQCALQKPELSSVHMLEQDIRDPWPDTHYDVIITTLCFHHIPQSDRMKILDRVFRSLHSRGVFICGDIIRPDSFKTENIYRKNWILGMKKAGMNHKDIEHIVHSRTENYTDMETIPGFIVKLEQTGFAHVLMPYRYEISAVFIGYKESIKERLT